MNRDDAIEKVRKLLQLADNHAASSGEAENAARQAAALMRKFNIESAEAQLKDLMSDEPDMARESVYAAYDPGAKAKQKEVPVWVGITAAGVAALCQVKADASRDAEGSAVIRFAGYTTDVVFATWLLHLLTRALFKEARNCGLESLKERGQFRMAAAGHLQKRLCALAEAERQALNSDASSGTALVVVNEKAKKIAEMFGAPEVKSVKIKYAGDIGQKAAQWAEEVNIPRTRPLTGKTNQARLSC